MRGLALSSLLLAAGCRGTRVQSVLEPHGPVAGRVESLWWFAFWTATAVYISTMTALLWSMWRARRRPPNEPLPSHDDGRMTGSVSIAIAATVVILLVFLGYDLSVGRTLRAPIDRKPLVVRVIGHQWWWEVQYPDSVPSRWVTDANEIHVPVGRPVLIELTSYDVIHSLWVPNLGGKQDLIPRYLDSSWFQADTVGIYRGQCAEFCGHQHAKMALTVVAHSPADFAAWRDGATRAASPPAHSLQRRGQEVFLSGPCAMCHAIQGTLAASRAGPDLTHIASRRTLAAGTLPNTRGNLAAWILDPQRVKPGTHMPPNSLSPADLESLLAYLESLK